MSHYPWYELVDASASLEQGDFLVDYPIPAVPVDLVGTGSGANLPVELTVHTYSLIIMSQSCDLQKIPEDADVLLCRRIPYPEAIAVNAKLRGPGGWSMLRKGHSLGLHLLDKCELGGHEHPYQIVDLQKIFSSPLRVVRAHVHSQGSRIRLCPPYREHLAQAFARQFMRVGLPADLPETPPKI